ncbi:MAG: rhodanese-like domain-containing protein [Rhodocyclaceae bacterium]|nr:rhodanese-like domain-containing protein [Rhodocyclaceae bacterium]
MADAPVTPLQAEGVVVVTALEANQLPPTRIFIDARAQYDYFVRRIASAIHVPYRERSKRQVDFDPAKDDIPAFLKRLHKFAPKKFIPLVFYCNGIHCWKSYKAVKAAINDGYQQVFWLRGGINEWVNAGLPTEGEY